MTERREWRFAVDWRAAAKIDRTETIWSGLGLRRSLKRRVASMFYCLPDTGVFGLTPLRTHIAVCGYPRSGTTMMLMMLEYALPRAKRFGHEQSGWRAAAAAWRNHAVMVSKAPNDVFKLHRLRNFYGNRGAAFRPILMLRDPRDVLTSRHVITGNERYFVDIPQWKDYTAYIQHYLNDPDVLVVRYEDFVDDVDGWQTRIESFAGERFDRPLNQFFTEERSDFRTRALNGVRPVDTKSVGRWCKPEHRARLDEILCDVPEFPQVLIDLGYEQDQSWTDRLPEPAGSSASPARTAA